MLDATGCLWKERKDLSVPMWERLLWPPISEGSGCKFLGLWHCYPLWEPGLIRVPDTVTPCWGGVNLQELNQGPRGKLAVQPSLSSQPRPRVLARLRAAELLLPCMERVLHPRQDPCFPRPGGSSRNRGSDVPGAARLLTFWWVSSNTSETPRKPSGRKLPPPTSSPFGFTKPR